jgi:hypothetical protein
MKYNTEQITYMLAEAIDQDREYKSWHVSTKHLMTLVARVVAEEREACAKLCDEIATEDGWEGGYAYRCVEAIRARGQV